MEIEVVTIKAAYLLERPNPRGATLGKLMIGTPIRVIESEKGWYQLVGQRLFIQRSATRDA